MAGPPNGDKTAAPRRLPVRAFRGPAVRGSREANPTTAIMAARSKLDHSRILVSCSRWSHPVTPRRRIHSMTDENCTNRIPMRRPSRLAGASRAALCRTLADESAVYRLGCFCWYSALLRSSFSSCCCDQWSLNTRFTQPALAGSGSRPSTFWYADRTIACACSRVIGPLDAFDR